MMDMSDLNNYNFFSHINVKICGSKLLEYPRYLKQNYSVKSQKFCLLTEEFDVILTDDSQHSCDLRRKGHT